MTERLDLLSLDGVTGHISLEAWDKTSALKTLLHHDLRSMRHIQY